MSSRLGRVRVYDTSGLGRAWDTAELVDGNYVIEVTATDAAGNSTTSSMTVTTDNGNASLTSTGPDHEQAKASGPAL